MVKNAYKHIKNAYKYINTYVNILRGGMGWLCPTVNHPLGYEYEMQSNELQLIPFLDGDVMVPIHPTGAVQLDFFKLAEPAEVDIGESTADPVAAKFHRGPGPWRAFRNEHVEYNMSNQPYQAIPHLISNFA